MWVGQHVHCPCCRAPFTRPFIQHIMWRRLELYPNERVELEEVSTRKIVFLLFIFDALNMNSEVNLYIYVFCFLGPKLHPQPEAEGQRWGGPWPPGWIVSIHPGGHGNLLLCLRQPFFFSFPPINFTGGLFCFKYHEIFCFVLFFPFFNFYRLYFFCLSNKLFNSCIFSCVSHLIAFYSIVLCYGFVNSFR